MRHRIQSTFFKLSAALSTKARNQVFDSIQRLPVEKQEKIAAFAIDTMLETIRDLMKSGLELQTTQPPKYVEAAQKFQKASIFADSLLGVTQTIGSNAINTELAEVYAQFASSLKRHAPHLASKEEIVKKSLSLDANNAIANELNVDMGFDQYLNEYNLSP